MAYIVSECPLWEVDDFHACCRMDIRFQPPVKANGSRRQKREKKKELKSVADTRGSERRKTQ